MTSSGKLIRFLQRLLFISAEPFEYGVLFGKMTTRRLIIHKLMTRLVKWAQHAAETGGDLKFNDNEESK